MANFLKEMFSGEKSISSKRVNGTVGWLVFIVYVGVFDHELIDLVGWISASLIGLDTLKSGLIGIKSNKGAENSEK